MEQQFKTVITSKHKLFDLHLKETFGYKDLIFLFVKRDFKAKYKQTILGPFWALIQPLLTTVVFTIIFGNLAGLTTADTTENYVLPGFLFYMAGNICWSYFSSNLSATSNTFRANSSIMGKVYYPRLVSPIASAFSNLIYFGIQFAMFIAIWLVYVIIGGTSIRVTPMILLVPLVVLEMMVLSTGCGIILSALTTKYRDLSMLVSFGLQLWQYASPIAYGLTLISVKHSGLMWAYMLNPVSSMVTAFRYGMFGFGYFDLTYYLVGWAISLALLFIGLLLFSRIERTFMDTI